MTRLATIRLPLMVFLLLAGGWREAAAVQTELFRYARMEDYQDASFRELILADDGSWRLGPRWEELLADELAFFSEMADDGETLLLAGGGDPGKLILFDKDRRRHRQIHSAPDLLFSCVETLAPGLWAVGSGPGGVVYRVDAEGTVTPWLETGEDFVWDLLLDGDTLWIATGATGKLLRHDLAAGTTEHFATVPDESAFTLALAADGGLLVGSSGEGLLLRYDDEGEALVLADFDAEEVQRILVLPGGDVVVAVARTDGECEENCASVYRIGGAGGMEKQLSSDSAFIGDLLPAAAGGFWVASGDPAELDRLTAPYRGEILGVEPDHYYSDLHDDGEALWILQSKPARLLRVAGVAESGELLSEVVDMRNRSRAGALRLEADLPRGCGFEVEARAGQGADPALGWTDWTACESDGDEPGDDLSFRMDLPAARYFQWRVRFLGKGGRSPRLHRITASYLPLNRSPLLGNLTVLRPVEGPFEDGIDLGGRPFTQVLERGVRVQYQLKSAPAPAADADPALLRGLRQVQWDWLDPDGDRLRARIELQRVGERQWSTLAEDWSQSLFTWDTRGLADGLYRLRVTADDAPDNPGRAARSSVLLSERVRLDSRPPRFELGVERVDERQRLRGSVADEGGGVLRSLGWRIAGGDWRALAAADGLMDRRRVELDVGLDEAFADLPAAGILELRAGDEFGNWSYFRTRIEGER